MLRNCNVIGSTCGKGTCWEYNMKFESFVKAADSIVKPWRNVSCFQAESMYINVHKSAGNMVTLLDLLHLVLKMTVKFVVQCVTVTVITIILLLMHLACHLVKKNHHLSKPANITMWGKSSQQCSTRSTEHTTTAEESLLFASYYVHKVRVVSESTQQESLEISVNFHMRKHNNVMVVHISTCTNSQSLDARYIVLIVVV